MSNPLYYVVGLVLAMSYPLGIEPLRFVREGAGLRAASGILLLFAIPSVTAASVLLLLDRHIGTHFYQYTFGGDPILWQHLFW